MRRRNGLRKFSKRLYRIGVGAWHLVRRNPLVAIIIGVLLLFGSASAALSTLNTAPAPSQESVTTPYGSDTKMEPDANPVACDKPEQCPPMSEPEPAATPMPADSGSSRRQTKDIAPPPAENAPPQNEEPQPPQNEEPQPPNCVLGLGSNCIL